MEEKIYKINVEKLVGLKRIMSYVFTIPSKEFNLEILYTPHIYLVPVYKYTPEINGFIRSVFGLRALKFKYTETIDFDYLSLFRPVKPMKRLLKFSIYLKQSEGELRIYKIEVERIHDSFDYEAMFDSMGRFSSHEWIKMVRMVRGDNYSDYDRRKSSYVYYSMRHIEKEMLLIATFLYSLYTGEYEAEDLPAQWVKFLRECGDNFDEVIKSLYSAINFMGL